MTESQRGLVSFLLVLLTTILCFIYLPETLAFAVALFVAALVVLVVHRTARGRREVVLTDEWQDIGGGMRAKMGGMEPDENQMDYVSNRLRGELPPPPEGWSWELNWVHRSDGQKLAGVFYTLACRELAKKGDWEPVAEFSLPVHADFKGYVWGNQAILAAARNFVAYREHGRLGLMEGERNLDRD